MVEIGVIVELTLAPTGMRGLFWAGEVSGVSLAYPYPVSAGLSNIKLP